MNNVAYADFRKPRAEGGRVADTDDGYTRLANELYEELIGADLTKNQAKVAHAVCRKTYGYNKKMDRIADSQLCELTNLPRQKVNKAKNELIAMKVLVVEGNRIGPNKNLNEWEITNCHQNGVNVTKTVTKSVTKTVTDLSPKQGHTKDNIQKTKEITPLPPLEVSECEGKKSFRNKPTPYQAVADAYNKLAEGKLAIAETLSDKRKRAIKNLLSKLKEPTAEAAGVYFGCFFSTARPFYFGENDRGWCANFDYLLREDTLIKTREGSL